MINEHKKGIKAPKYTKKAKGIEPPKPRNPVAKNATSAIGGGAAGAHKDKKKAAKAGEVKHKKLEVAESYDRKLELMLELSSIRQKIQEVKSAREKWNSESEKRKKKHDAIAANQTKDGSGMSSAINRLEKHVNAKEGWTHDTLAAELFEMPTYENRLREMLEGQVSFLEGGTEERVTMASKKPGSQHHLNDADQGNIDDMHLRSVHPSDKGDEDEYGMEGEYLRNELHTIMRVCKHLEHAIDDSEDLPTWVIDKMSQAKGMIVMVMDYLISEKEETLDKQSGKEDHMMK